MHAQVIPQLSDVAITLAMDSKDQLSGNNANHPAPGYCSGRAALETYRCNCVARRSDLSRSEALALWMSGTLWCNALISQPISQSSCRLLSGQMHKCCMRVEGPEADHVFRSTQVSFRAEGDADQLELLSCCPRQRTPFATRRTARWTKRARHRAASRNLLPQCLTRTGPAQLDFRSASVARGRILRSLS